MLNQTFIKSFRGIKEAFIRRYSILYIRETFSMFGFNTDDFTDKELEEKIIDSVKFLKSTGCTAKELLSVSNEMDKLGRFIAI